MPRASHGATSPKDKYRKDVPCPSVGVTVFGGSYPELMARAVEKAAVYFGEVPEGREITTEDSFTAQEHQWSTDGTVLVYKATLHCQLRTLNPDYDPLAGTALEDDEDEDLDDDDE